MAWLKVSLPSSTGIGATTFGAPFGAVFADGFFAGFAVFAFKTGFAAFVGRRAATFFAAFFTGFLGIPATSHLRPKRRKYVGRLRESQATSSQRTARTPLTLPGSCSISPATGFLRGP